MSSQIAFLKASEYPQLHNPAVQERVSTALEKLYRGYEAEAYFQSGAGTQPGLVIKAADYVSGRQQEKAEIVQAAMTAASIV